MDEVDQTNLTPDGSFNVDIYIYMVDPDKLTHYYLSSDKCRGFLHAFCRLLNVL